MEPRVTALVNRERVLLAGGQRALLMQLALAGSAASRILLPWLPPVVRDFSRARAAASARRE